jgi:hypothetical protein
MSIFLLHIPFAIQNRISVSALSSKINKRLITFAISKGCEMRQWRCGPKSQSELPGMKQFELADFFWFGSHLFLRSNDSVGK